jgi:hypothetical protein
MKILQIGKNGMVRSQQGTWFTSGHFKSFFIGQHTDSMTKDPWIVYGDSGGDFVELGSFSTEKLAQDELDKLFISHEDYSDCSDASNVRSKHSPALDKKISKDKKTAKGCPTDMDEHKAKILASMQDHIDKIGAEESGL